MPEEGARGSARGLVLRDLSNVQVPACRGTRRRTAARAGFPHSPTTGPNGASDASAYGRSDGVGGLRVGPRIGYDRVITELNVEAGETRAV